MKKRWEIYLSVFILLSVFSVAAATIVINSNCITPAIVKFCNDGSIARYDCDTKSFVCPINSENTPIIVNPPNTNPECVVPKLLVYCKDGTVAEYDCKIRSFVCSNTPGTDSSAIEYGEIYPEFPDEIPETTNAPDTNCVVPVIVRYCSDGSIAKYDCDFKEFSCSDTNDEISTDTNNAEIECPWYEKLFSRDSCSRIPTPENKCPWYLRIAFPSTCNTNDNSNDLCRKDLDCPSSSSRFNGEDFLIIGSCINSVCSYDVEKSS